MDLTDLRIFRAVVEAGGITRAAKRLHRVQSNVTTRVKQLEEKLGLALFLREGKSLRLSPAGHILFRHAEQILALVERAHEAIHETTPRGTLRLGAMESTAAARLPGPLCEYHDRYPDMAVDLFTGPPSDQIARILACELDAALVVDPISDPRLASLPIFEEELVIIAGAKHPPILSPRDIQSPKVLAFHAGCPQRSRLESWFAKEGVTIERVLEMTSFHAMLGCAVAGMGIALIPLSVLKTYSERSHLSVHPLESPEFGQTKSF